jgi:adenylyl-sulfate kinase
MEKGSRTDAGAGVVPSRESPPKGFCLWFTGLPSAGKTTLAKAVLPLLEARGFRVELLDGDEIRKGLSADLGFDKASREKHADRVAYVARLLARHGVVAVVALISPYRASRARARAQIGEFVEVFVATPIAICEARDVKGLYRRARAGEIRDMTGVDDPYEPPEGAEIVIDTQSLTPHEAAAEVLRALERMGRVHAPPAGSSRRAV